MHNCANAKKQQENYMQKKNILSVRRYIVTSALLNYRKSIRKRNGKNKLQRSTASVTRKIRHDVLLNL